MRPMVFAPWQQVTSMRRAVTSDDWKGHGFPQTGAYLCSRKSRLAQYRLKSFLCGSKVFNQGVHRRTRKTSPFIIESVSLENELPTSRKRRICAGKSVFIRVHPESAKQAWWF